MDIDNKNQMQKRLLIVVVVLFWFAQYVYIPYQTTYLFLSGISAETVGLIVGVYGFTQLVLRLPVGVMADKVDMHKIFIIIGVVASGSASLIRIFLPPAKGFFIGNLFSGIASAMWISFMVLYFLYFPKGEQQRASGFIVAANNAGILLGFVVSTLLYKRFGMKLMCWLSVYAAIAALCLAFFLYTPKNRSKKFGIRELISVYSNKRLIAFSILALIQQGIQMATSMSFTAQIIKLRGANDFQIGLCSIIYIFTAVVSSYFAASKTAGRLGAHFWVPIIFVGLAVYCVSIPKISDIGWICAAQVLSGLSTGILFSYCTSEAMVNVPKNKVSTAMGFYQAVYALGMAVFPAATGYVANKFSLSSAFYILFIIAFAGFIISLLIYKHINKDLTIF